MNQTISVVSQQENKYKAEIENLETSMIELSEKENHHLHVIDNFKHDIENYTQTIDHLSEHESQYKLNIENLEQMITDKG